jgi:hypothetical protein
LTIYEQNPFQLVEKGRDGAGAMAVKILLSLI